MAQFRRAVNSVPVNADTVTSRWTSQGYFPNMGMIFHEGGLNTSGDLSVRVLIAEADIPNSTSILSVLTKVGQHQHQTSAKIGPKILFNETFTYSAHPNDKISLQLIDQDRRLCGESHFSINDIPVNRGTVEKWVPLAIGGHANGHVLVKLDVTHSTHGQVEFRPNFDQSKPWNTYAAGNERRLWNDVPVPVTTIITLITGEVQFTVGNSQYDMRPGDELILPAKSLYSAISKGGQYSTWLYAFRDNSSQQPQVIQYNQVQEHVGGSLRLEVFITEATDILGYSGAPLDAFVTVRTGHQQWSTSTKSNTLHPVWNEGHIFNIDNGVFLNFRLQDKEGPYGQIIGEASFPVEDLNLRQQQVEKWVPISRQGQRSANLRVIFRLEGSSTQSNQYHQQPHFDSHQQYTHYEQQTHHESHQHSQPHYQQSSQYQQPQYDQHYQQHQSTNHVHQPEYQNSYYSNTQDLGNTNPYYYQ